MWLYYHYGIEICQKRLQCPATGTRRYSFQGKKIQSQSPTFPQAPTFFRHVLYLFIFLQPGQLQYFIPYFQLVGKVLLNLSSLIFRKMLNTLTNSITALCASPYLILLLSLNTKPCAMPKMTISVPLQMQVLLAGIVLCPQSTRCLRTFSYRFC